MTETGDKLVVSLIDYLKWLGFKNVRNCDLSKSKTDILEEDIQVKLDNGLLVIECKGIVGTSTDNHCSQISKIKTRRCKERNKLGVHALYVVNHQRNLPPLERKNPPFTENQITDANHEERGLLSTWQLFNLYLEIKIGILSKEEARSQIIKHGLISFRPKNLELIGKPVEILKGGTVCIIKIKSLQLKIGDEIYSEKNGRFNKHVIKEIKIDDKPVNTANSGELGIQLDSKIEKKTELWKKPAVNKWS